MKLKTIKKRLMDEVKVTNLFLIFNDLMITILWLIVYFLLGFVTGMFYLLLMIKIIFAD